MALHLQKDVDDGSIPKEVHEPKEEEGDANDMDDQWVLWRELPPMGVDELEDILRDPVEVGGALGVNQVVLGVHVDAMLRLPSHLCHHKWRHQLVSNSFGHHPERRGQAACHGGEDVETFYTTSRASYPAAGASLKQELYLQAIISSRAG